MEKIPKPEKGFYQVLWVEDDQEVIKNFSMAAEKKNIQLTALNCWNDANIALASNYNRWDAIILDAKCKHYPPDFGNAPPNIIFEPNCHRKVA